MHGFDVTMEYMEDRQLLALQGHGAAAALSRLAPSLNLSHMPFMAGAVAEVAGIANCRITRCGYTGEDGFEVSVDATHAPELMTALLDQPEVQPCGLGARDSLRLEAGLCLYGNDLDEDTNPAEAALTWTIGGPKSRRRIEQGFLGADAFLTPEGKLKKQQRKRVGVMGMKAPARAGRRERPYWCSPTPTPPPFSFTLLLHHLTRVFCSVYRRFVGLGTEIFDLDGTSKLGTITSGGFGPTVGKPVAMGYISPDAAKADTDVMVNIRGKMQPAKVTAMPFCQTNYFRVEE